MYKLITILISAVFCLSLVACGSGGAASDEIPSENQTESNAEDTIKPYSIQLSNGNYTSGIDIPSGIYSLKAISGTGRVTSSNIADGGINKMIGIDDGPIVYEETAEDINLSEGTRLTISGGVVLELSCGAAKVGAMEKRKVEGSKCSLDSGSYTAGNDFDPGVYNIKFVSGSGHVGSSNVNDGGIDAIMGPDDGSDFYEQEYKNIELPEGTTLEVTDVKIKLTPSR